MTLTMISGVQWYPS